jgi:hypothetical protein
MLAVLGAVPGVFTRALSIDVIAVATAFDGGGAIGVEGDGIRQDEVEGLGETRLVQGLALAELLGGAQGRLLPALALSRGSPCRRRGHTVAIEVSDVLAELLVGDGLC